MYILDVTFKIPCHWIDIVNGEILYMNCRPWGRSGVKAFLIVKGRIIPQKLASKGGVRVFSVENIDSETIASIIGSNICKCRLAGLSNLHILSAKVIGSYIKMRIIAESRREARNIVGSMRTAGIYIAEYTIRKATSRDFLTSRQREILISALNYGYYRTPKNTNINNIASKLGISKPRAWELLRQGVSKLISRVADGGII